MKSKHFYTNLKKVFLLIALFAMLFMSFPYNTKAEKNEGYNYDIRKQIITSFTTRENWIRNNQVINTSETNYFIFGICQTKEERAQGIYFPPYDMNLHVDGEEFQLNRLKWRDKEGIYLGEPVTWWIFYHVVEPNTFEPGTYHYFSLSYSFYNLFPRQREESHFDNLKFYVEDAHDHIEYFDHFPVEMDKIDKIIPLGNLNPPGHTFPTDHIYFMTNPTIYQEGFNVFAPGDIVITRISKICYDPPQDGTEEDYSIDFYRDGYVNGRFGHINSLSQNLSDIVGEFGEEYGDYVTSWQIADRTYTSYEKSLNLDIDSGMMLGTAGKAGGYDFWLKDTHVELNWVNQEWTQHFQHTVCPLEYFEKDLQNTMKSKLKNWDGSPVYPANYCGKIDYDIPNTAQGIWTKHDYVNRAEEYGLSLVYDNFNASLGAISVGMAGDNTWDCRVYHFTPKDDGFRNRKFSEVTNDGNIYYYLCDEFEYSSGYNKVILLKVTADREIRFQFINYGTTLIPADPTSLWNESKSILYIR
jgi:hypothetical protein